MHSVASAKVMHSKVCSVNRHLPLMSLQSGQGLLRRVEIKDFDMACSVVGEQSALRFGMSCYKNNGLKCSNRYFFAD
jgi:hypothetical protein